ncbi:MAG: AI-2E family transporter [Gemmatimonadales bacterium]|nr:AI-2E family transporter [Gemmatimonadales bacterium]
METRIADRVLWGVALLGGAALLLFLWAVRDVLLLGFAGVLLAVLFRTPAEWLHSRLGIPVTAAVGLVVVLTLGALIGAFWLHGGKIGEQVTELRKQLPQAAAQIKSRLQQTSWGQKLVEEVPAPEELLPDAQGAVERATGVLSGTLAVLTNGLVILFLGVVFALGPQPYLSGIVRLVPIARRDRAREVLRQLGSTLRWWLFGRLISMTVIGLLTGIGLSLLGVPLAIALALFAALLSFIPNVGPILALVPAVLLGFLDSPTRALHVGLLYIGVQIVETYVLAPFIDKKTIYLPPALTVLAQLAMAVFAGLLGVALATPILAVTVVLVRSLYVEEVLGDQASTSSAFLTTPLAPAAKR